MKSILIECFDYFSLARETLEFVSGPLISCSFEMNLD